MTAKTELVDKKKIVDLILSDDEIKLSQNERKSFSRVLGSTAAVWVGKVDGHLVCIWGLVPPSLADDRAYLWLHATERVREYEFTFVRQSQIAVRKMLEMFPTIYGHCETDAVRSRRWVKWLGATFGEPEGALIPFQIVRQNG